MPDIAKRPCKHHGCSQLVSDGSGYCAAHQGDRKQGKFADRARGSRHARGYGSAWDRLRKQIMTRDCGLCQPCLARGVVASADAVDHKVPKAEGGTDDPENLQAICRPCHDAKTQAEAGRGRGG